MKSIRVLTLYSILSLLVALAATQVAAQGVYVEMPNMPDSRMVFHAGLHSGDICCALGVSNWPDPSTVPPPEYLADQVYRFNESSGDWLIQEGPAFYGIMSYAAVIDDFVYSAGGAKLGGWIKDSVFRYNLATGEEDTLASLPRALVTGQAFNDNGKFHLMGGHNGGSPDPANLVYDPSTDMWSAEPSLPGGLERHALANIGNKVYLIGGRGLGGYPQSNVNLIYNLDTKTYSYGASLPVAIKDAGCAELDGEIYILGGWTETPSKHAVDIVQIYNPDTDTWRLGTPLPEPNVGMQAVEDGGAIYLIGGWNLIQATNRVYKYEIPRDPIVLSTTPGSNEINVPASVNIDARFDISLDEASLEESVFGVQARSSGYLTGSLLYSSSTDQLIFDPLDDFNAGEMVTVVLTSDITSSSGGQLVNGYSWSFVTAVACGTGEFDPYIKYPSGDWTHSVFAADIDNDGDLDLVTANQYSDDVSVFSNNGDGSLGLPVSYATGDGPISVYVADLDRDGDLDLATANFDSHGLSVLLNDGAGAFPSHSDYSVGTNPRSVCSADLNGDGWLDLVTANTVSSNVSVLLNDGSASFPSCAFYSAKGSSSSVVAVDVDVDGDLDLATANAGSNTISILKNNGDATFASAATYAAPGHPLVIYAADLNGDSSADLATSNGYYSASVLLNDGNGIFPECTSYSVGGNAFSIYGGDYDADGDIDLVTSNNNPGTVSILLNEGDGTYADDVVYSVGTHTVAVFSADLDGDRDLDIITGNHVDGSISILFNSGCCLTSQIEGNVTEGAVGLQGISVDLYNSTGLLEQSTVTDASGAYQFGDLTSGEDYTLGIVVPLGYEAENKEFLIDLGCGEIVTVEFALNRLETVGRARGTGYWKHQIGVAVGGSGGADFTPEQLCGLLDLISEHFNSNEINQVVLYDPPESDLCEDKLAVASDLLNLQGDVGLRIRAQQALMALLFNVAAGHVHQQDVISADGATVSQAITFCDNLIDDPDGDHDLAIYICGELNHSRTLDAGVVPLNTLNIVYKQLPLTFALSQNYPNPFNPSTEICFSLPHACQVRLEIFNISGQRMQTLVNRQLDAGYHTVSFDGGKVASGVYLYRLQADDFVESKKMILVK